MSKGTWDYLMDPNRVEPKRVNGAMITRKQFFHGDICKSRGMKNSIKKWSLHHEQCGAIYHILGRLLQFRKIILFGFPSLGSSIFFARIFMGY